MSGLWRGQRDGRRVYVLNRGSDTITVINSQNNTLDQCTPFTNQNGQPVTCHPSLPLSTAAGLTGRTCLRLQDPSMPSILLLPNNSSLRTTTAARSA